MGGQDCRAEISGAYTGDVAAEQLADAGAELVLAVNDAGLLGFRSLTSAMCLAQTLAMGLAFRDRRGGQTGALDDIDC